MGDCVKSLAEVKMNGGGRKKWDGLVESSCSLCHITESGGVRHCLGCSLTTLFSESKEPGLP